MKERTAYKIVYALLRPFFAIVYPLRYVGKEHIPADGALICANHCSDLDPFFVGFGLGMNRQIRPMAKESLLHIPVIGWILKAIGTFGVKRGASDIHAIKFAMDQLRAGEYVVLFPEGTRVKNRADGQPKTGAAMLAARTGVNVLPVYVPQKKRLFRKNVVYFGKPFRMIPAGKRPTNEEYQTFTADLMDRIYSAGDGK